MAKDQYVAYVGTYTNGTSRGIHIYDVDVDEGLIYLRRVVPIRNSSYIMASNDGKYLYSLADEGVMIFSVLEDGDLKPVNKIRMDGMRGHQMARDRREAYIYVAGYHDGKVTMIRTQEDGRLGRQTYGTFHKGTGGINQRGWQPHVTSVRMTPDNKFLCAADNALDQIVIYRVDHEAGRLRQIDILRMGREAGPRSIHFSRDGRYAYVLCEITCTVRQYAYELDKNGFPVFELVDEYSTLFNKPEIHDAAASMNLSYDGKYLFCTTAGENSLALFSIDQESGRLTRLLALPTSGNFPKAAALFPDQKHIAVVNNDSNTITSFAINYEKGTLVMKGRPHKVDRPNCMIFLKVDKAPETFRNISEDEAEAEAADRMEEIRRRTLEDNALL